jgi:hydrogenase small subunit
MTPSPEGRPLHVLWLTSGLGCDGDSIAMTSATNPSLEDLLRGSLPGIPPIVLCNPVLAFESGEEFMRIWDEAAAGRLDPFVLVLEGSVPNEDVNGDGHWAGMGVDAVTGQPILTNEWIDRLTPRAAAVLALGTCAAYGGVPAMRNNPTGAMGLRDYLGWEWQSQLGIPVVNLPGCPVQPDNITQTLLRLALQLAGLAPPIDLDEQGRPVEFFDRTVHERCDRAGFADQAQFSEQLGDGRCLVKLGCSGPVARCNVPMRGWVNGVGGCPNVGGICTACTMPGFPDRFMPFMEPDAGARLYARTARFGHGPFVRYMRNRRMKRIFDVEPEWRRRGPRLTSGYEAR